MNDSASEFVSLWTRYQPEVRRYVCMLVPKVTDVEDVMQQTASRLWAKFGQYDSERRAIRNFIGRMDEMTIWNVALDEQQIAEIYENSHP